jgi:hypothetical protein
MENSIQNYNEIINFISDIKNYLDPTDYDKIIKCIKFIIRIIIDNFYGEYFYFNFDDIKYIIEYIYQKEIIEYENYIKINKN